MYIADYVLASVAFACGYNNLIVYSEFPSDRGIVEPSRGRDLD